MEVFAGLNILDIIILALILLLSIKGLLNGFGKEFFNALGLIGGIFLAAFFYHDLSTYVQENFFDISINVLDLISKIVIFGLTWLIAGLIGKLFGNGLISAASRLGGMIVKLIAMFFVFSILAYLVSTNKQVTEKFKDTISGSKLYPLLTEVGAEILSIKPSAPKLQPAAKDNKTGPAAEANATKTEPVEISATKAEPAETNSTKAEPAETNSTKAELAETNTSKPAAETNTTSPSAEANATKTEPAETNKSKEPANKQNAGKETEENKSETKPVKFDEIKPTKELNSTNSDTNSSEK